MARSWLYRSSILPVSQATNSLRGYTVGNLMEQNSKSWNQEVVRHIFTKETSQMILNIPLFPQVTEDKLPWNPEKNGHYSVKSAYRLCVEEIVDNLLFQFRKFSC